MIPQDSQNFESFVPVYDAIPEKWDDARSFIVEQLKKISQAVNIREIGWLLDEELLTGKQFIIGANQILDGYTSEQFRTVLRKVIVFPSLSIGANSEAHGITIDGNFTLLQLYGAVTNSSLLTGQPIPNGADTISYTSTEIIITVAAAWTFGIAVIEYCQEI
jgi:hypothetical protein